MKKLISIVLLVSFLTTTQGSHIVQAQELTLPVAGVRGHLSPEFNPPILRGIKVYPDNPFRFEFVLDQGDRTSLEAKSESILAKEDYLKTESTKLIKYFLASLTVPEKDLWVNLSPYEKDRIVPESFGQTEMGRDLLAQDYILKQITASLIYPEDEVGKKFWKRIYEEAARRYGTTSVSVNTFNKVWIVPEKAVVYENTRAGTAYVVEARLKVMLEEDYLSLEKYNSDSPPLDPPLAGLVGGARGGGDSQNPPSLTLPAGRQASNTKGEGINNLGSNIIREIIIPELTKEINEGKNFAQLRQVYNSLILATWYKKKIKESILSQVYEDKNKVAGVGFEDVGAGSKPAQEQRAGLPAGQAGLEPAPTVLDVTTIYKQYLTAFKKGVYNYIKEESDPVTQQPTPRKYFSGGWTALPLDHAMTIVTRMSGSLPHSAMKVDVRLDQAMNSYTRLDPALETIIRSHRLALDLTGAASDGSLKDIPTIEYGRYLQEYIWHDSQESLKRFDFYRDATSTPDNGHIGSQVGPFIFMEEEFFDTLSAQEKEQIQDRVVRYHRKDSLWRYAPYATGMIFALMHYPVSEYGFIDSGAGKGILALSTLKMGAPFVYLADHDPEALAAARRTLILNNYEEGKDFFIEDIDLRNFDLIKELTKKVKAEAIKRGKKLALISNIGEWEEFSVSNTNSLNFVKASEGLISLAFLTGYNLRNSVTNSRVVANDEKVFKEFKMQSQRIVTASNHMDVVLLGELNPSEDRWNKNNIAMIFTPKMIKHLPVKIELANITKKDGPPVILQISKYSDDIYDIKVFVNDEYTGSFQIETLTDLLYVINFFHPIGDFDSLVNFDREVNLEWSGKGVASTILNWLAWTAKQNNVQLGNSGTETFSLLRLYQLFFAGEIFNKDFYNNHELFLGLGPLTSASVIIKVKSIEGSSDIYKITNQDWIVEDKFELGSLIRIDENGCVWSENKDHKIGNIIQVSLTQRKGTPQYKELPRIKILDNAQLVQSVKKGQEMGSQGPGGIDLTSDQALQVKNDGNGELEFHLDSAQLAQLQNAPGFVPVIINIEPLIDLEDFLGISSQEKLANV
ncbi:MAG: 50S ribosomal protein L11 methyltransferase [Candidatus Omnitrophica bacterium]|nr:50S ribosomal protein L11 methyltransferase [Candidatus Omnitrophota bacterium]